MTLRPHAHYRLALLPALLLLVSCDGDTPNAPQGPPVGGVGEGVIETYAPAETILETFMQRLGSAVAAHESLDRLGV